MVFDDGWDGQETALFLAVNEEMQEEARWLAQQRQEYDADIDEAEDFEPPLGHYGGGTGGSRLRPFEQFVQDYLNGEKSLDDPMYGPGRMALHDHSVDTTTTIMGVPIKSAQLVPEKLLAVLAQVLTAVEQISIAKIIFDSSGGPVIDGRPIHGTFDAGLQEVRINLCSLWQMAERIASMERNHLRLDALVWHGMLEVLLHECYHGLPPEEGVSQEIQFCDEHATFWAQHMIVDLFRHADLEPPGIQSDPFFGPRITKFLNENHQFSRFQQQLFDAGVIYRNETVGVQIKDLKTYYAVLAGDDCGIPHQGALQDVLNLEARYFDELNKRPPMGRPIPTETKVDPAPEEPDPDTSLEFYLDMVAELLKREHSADDRRALEYTERVLKLAPANFDALMNRGLAAGRLGMVEKALDSYMLAAQLYPKNDKPYAAAGYTLRKAGDIDAALKMFNKAIARNPNNYETFNNRSVTWAQIGEFEKALADAKRCVELGGPDEFYRYLMGER